MSDRGLWLNSNKGTKCEIGIEKSKAILGGISTDKEVPSTEVRLMGPMPYTALQSMFDAIYPPGSQWYWRGDFLGKIPEEAIDQHLKFGKALPTLHSTMHCYPVDGFPSRVGRHETAFSYREAKWSMVIVGVDPDPANAEKITKWTKDYWAAPM